MQWLALMLVVGFAVGLRGRPGRGAQALVVLAVTVVAGAWYFQLGHGG